MQNRTADLLLTMETLYRLSYRGQRFTRLPHPVKRAQIGAGKTTGILRENAL